MTFMKQDYKAKQGLSQHFAEGGISSFYYKGPRPKHLEQAQAEFSSLMDQMDKEVAPMVPAGFISDNRVNPDKEAEYDKWARKNGVVQDAFVRIKIGDKIIFARHNE